MRCLTPDVSRARGRFWPRFHPLVTPRGYCVGMAVAEGRRTSHDEPWTAAVLLAQAVASGERLPLQVSPVLLEPGESLHASVTADAWRYLPLDVPYGQQRVVAVGGPLLLGLTAAAVAIGNRRARQAAERQAAPQWRTLGHLPVLATNHRLLVLHERSWASVWYNAIRQVRPALPEYHLGLVFEDAPPYALEGPWVPYLAVVLATVLAHELGTEAVRDALLPV